MPVVQAYESKLVLVTGANGFIALWIIRNLLKQGYRVRGTVRSQEKGRIFLETFKEYGDRVEFVIVDDFTKEDAFDAAVKDVDAIQHLAAPSSLTCDDPDDLIKPSVSGTMGVLTSALKYGTRVKRIVVTSACAALMRNAKVPGEVYDENDWADEAIHSVNKLGRAAPSLAKVRAAKALAERGAWNFFEKHRDEVKWDLVTILPPVTIGPPLQEVTTPADLNLSLALFYKLLFTDQQEETLKATYNYVHVQDVAHAHVESLKTEAAGGQRIIIWGGAINIQNNRNIIHALYPELYASGMLPRGNPEINEPVVWTYNPEKGVRILGMKYRAIEDISKDMVHYFTSKGWFKEGLFPRS